MLDPNLVLDALVTGLRDIPALIAELGSPDHVLSHQYGYGSDNSIQRAIEQMPEGSLLVAYSDLLSGDFGSMILWKHRFQIAIRPQNGGANPPHLWWLAMNGVMTSTSQNIRYTNLLDHRLLQPEVPTLNYQQDALGFDYFIGSIIFPESGDD